MKHGHSCHTSDELEIGQVILIAQARVGVDLQSVVVPGERREDSMEQENSIPTHSFILQSNTSEPNPY